MAKCRLLYQENEELGRIVTNARLQNDIEIHRNLCEDLKRSQVDFEGIIQDLDLDVEGFASNIILLQQKVKTLEEEKSCLEKELNASKRGAEANDVDQPQQKKQILEGAVEN